MIKQVIVMLKKFSDEKGNSFSVRKGKMCAQASHSSVSFLAKRLRHHTGNTYKIDLSEPEIKWIEGNFAKICVGVETDEELMQIFQKAKDAGLETHLITDNGLTEFKGRPTRTCLAIGPDYSEKIDPITSHLTLL